MPLICCVIDHAVVEAMRQTLHRLLQFINVMKFRMVAPVLNFSPNSVVNYTKTGLLAAVSLVK